MAVAIGFFLFLPHQEVVGSNGIAPLIRVTQLRPGERVCERMREIPQDVTVSVRATPSAGVRTTIDRPHRVCVANAGGQPVWLYGESPVRGATRRPVVGIAFVERHSSTWFSRLGEIETRYGYSTAGLVGTWGIWVAGVLAALGALLAFGLIMREAFGR